jgi:hypothetical protein
VAAAMPVMAVAVEAVLAVQAKMLGWDWEILPLRFDQVAALVAVVIQHPRLAVF